LTVIRHQSPGLFFTGWGSSPAVIFVEKLHGIQTKGEEKTYENSIFGENCMILKIFLWGSSPIPAPAIKEKKALQSCLYRFNFEAQSGDNLCPCNFHRVLAKDVNFEPKEGHFTIVNKNLNVQ
jgi:hypothetical protein